MFQFAVPAKVQRLLEARCKSKPCLCKAAAERKLTGPSC